MPHSCEHPPHFCSSLFPWLCAVSTSLGWCRALLTHFLQTAPAMGAAL